ncbi:hypothetical protein AOQ84DRAFT_280565, partial [Glonium stellatum]
VEIVVGEDHDSKTYTLPKELICRHSQFFSAACEGSFKEPIEKRVLLPEERPEIFDLFVE